MGKTGRLFCMILALAFVFGTGAFGGAFADVASAAGAFETVPGSALAGDVPSGVLRSLLPRTTVRTLEKNFTEPVSVYKADGEAVSEETALCTGFTVKNAAGGALTVVIAGDLTGDGAVSAADYAAAACHTRGTAMLTGARFNAADSDGDGTVSAADLAALKSCLCGASDLYKGVRGRTYELVSPLPKYESAGDAEYAVFSTGTAAVGIYYVHRDYPVGLNGMYCLTVSRSASGQGFWINPRLNTSAPTVYSLMRPVNKYASADDAANQVNATGIADEAVPYFVYKGYPAGVSGMLNITPDKTGNTRGFWINPCENLEKLNYRTIKGVWLSQFDMSKVYTTRERQTPQNAFREKIRETFLQIRDCGYNTVIMQVHPNGDSFYESRYFPWSKYVTGAYGVKAGYDPLPIITEEARRLALSVHAWINPMRLMSASEITQIGTDNTIGQWYNDPTKKGKYLAAVNGLYYLNPGYTDVRVLIENAVKEVCDNYDVDGIHFDDYFYPEGVTGAFDREAYRASGQVNLASFRTSAVNDFIRRVYAECSSRGIKFGISPAGTISVNDAAYADVRKWCRESGYADYIAPQLYWGYSSFDSTLDDWEALMKTPNVRLVPAVTLSHARDLDSQEWIDNKDVIKRELQRAEACKYFGGVMAFSLKDFYNPINGTYTSQLLAERANYEPVLKAMHIKN